LRTVRLSSDRGVDRRLASRPQEGGKMNRKSIPAIVMIAVSLAVSGSMARAAQGKYTVKVPGGLAFSEFRGYEDWQTVASATTKR
jgi:hypothetical protein